MTGFSWPNYFSPTIAPSMMDITAMLNASAEVGGLPKLEDNIDNMDNLLRTRTPWDAGGYALPIHTHPLGSFTDDSFPNGCSAGIHIDQSRHKLSDSHSSLGSFVSSNSISHSRISSMSTVSSLQLPNQIISDSIFRDSETSSHSSKTATGSCSPVSPRTGRSSSQCSSSPALCGNGLALIAERHFYGSPRKDSVDQLFTVIETSNICSTDFLNGNEDWKLPTALPRAASPSDAILIKRATPPTIRYPTEQTATVKSEYFHTSPQTLSRENMGTTRGQQPDRLSIQIRGHKRAVSAPDLPGAMSGSLQNRYETATSSNPIAGLTPPSSPPEMPLLALTALSSAPISPPPEERAATQDRRPCCMYIPNCDTGSQLRKAVSHIFGRNKMCTRRIPPHVWVWYCRKHYQRARYRNAKEWARTLQYDLVSRQIRRLQEWSDENLRAGEGGLVQDYRLAIRKREQRRLDAQKPRGGRDCSDSETEDTTESQVDASSTTAVPEWLLNLSGRSHDARRIMEIIDGIQTDLTENNLSAWPDIEILPNIILERDESNTAAKDPSKTALSGLSGAHGRSQSLDSGARFDEDSTGAWTSRTGIPPSDGPSIPGNNSQKRKRSDDREETNDIQSTPQSQRIRVSERQVAAVRQEPRTAQRPVFQDFNENQGAEESFGNIELRGENFPLATDAQILPLAAPRPQKYNALSTATCSDPSAPSSKGRYLVVPRGLHKRSHSDMGALHSFQTPLRMSTRQQNQSFAPIQYERPTPRRFFTPPVPYISLSYREEHVQSPRAHTRHQSTPVVPISIQYPSSFPKGYHTLPRISSPSLSSHGNATESIRTLDLYNGRH